MKRKPITATEIREREKEHFKRWQEAEEKALKPMIDALYRLVKEAEDEKKI